MILGIDKGTTYTKSSENKIIRSTIRKFNNDILFDDKLTVEIFNKKYIIGEKGNYSTDLMKPMHENTKILVYTMIGLSIMQKYVETDLVVGLPIGLYARQKQNMKNLFTNDEIYMNINGNDKHIKINRIEVFPECAGAFYSQTEKNALIIDIGGLSIDIGLFENSKLIKYSTYSMGTMKLYSKIANEINSQYDLSLTEWDIPKILNEGLYIYGMNVPIKTEEIIKNHALEIIERLKLEYEIKATKNVLLTGGGSLLLADYLKYDIPQSKLINVKFANAIGFKKVGEVIFK